MFVNVVPYDPSWPRYYQRIVVSLCSALQGIEIIDIQHVGGTSIEGLAGRPCIDIDIVASVPNIYLAVAALQKAGFLYERKKYMLDEHYFSSPAIKDTAGREIKSNICVCPGDSKSLKNENASPPR
jgi:GrpB-like predicted nucleotidyltransferase (UPF0157 family)